MDKTEFVFETGGNCCLCLKLVTSSEDVQTQIKPEPGVPQKQLTSFQKLCQYLRVDLKELFDKASGVPLDKLPPLDKCEFKGSLCINCANNSAKFSQLYLELEVIRIKLKSCLKTIYNEIIENDEECTLLESLQVKFGDNVEKLSNLEVIGRLRKEILSKAGNVLDFKSPSIALDRVEVVQIVKQDDIKPFITNNEANEKQLETDQVLAEDSTATFAIDVTDVKVFRQPQPSKSRNSVKKFVTSSSNATKQGQVLGIQNKSSVQTSREQSSSAALSCDICKKSFASKKEFQAHKWNSHLKEKFKCDICDKPFKRKDYLRDHVNAMHNGTHWKCEFCTASFIYRTGLTRHLRQCGPSHKKSINAGIKTGNEVDIKTERLEEIGPNPKNVGDKLSSPPSASLSLNEISPQSVVRRKKTVEKQFECDLCHNRYSTKGSVARHKECVHGNDNKVPESSSSQLQRTFNCKYCKRVFPMAGTLHLHVTRFHSQEDPTRRFECDLCHVRFKRIEHLKNHQWSVHTGKKFKCKFCSTKFKTKGSAQLHLDNYCQVYQYITKSKNKP